jgi:ribosome-associated protein
MIKIENFSISDLELKIHFVRSSGAGGQNVNKLSTKAVLQWNVNESKDLPRAIKERFLKRWSTRISKKGEITLTSDKYRQRQKNLDELFNRLKAMITEVLYPPKKRIKTRASKGSIERRIKEKKLVSERKKYRRKPDFES